MDFVAITQDIQVADGTSLAIVDESKCVFELAERSKEAQIVAAIHIGGLNARETPGFKAALADSAVVYADGVGVVLLARIAGAKSIQRAATTDIGIPIITAISRSLNRPARVALLGGGPGLAETAAVALERLAPSEVVYMNHGFHAEGSWADVLQSAGASKPDIVLIGLGSPQELIFASANRSYFPGALIVTCGGWFGFLAGVEPRAPQIAQTLGLEWLVRMSRSPRRLTGRYIKGVFVFARLAVPLIVQRFRQ